MAGLGNLFQKAVYLGVGIASYAGDKVSQNIGELKAQAQTLADELVQRGEMTTEEARRMVDDLVSRAQATTVEGRPVDGRSQAAQNATKGDAPRTIEIDLDEESTASRSPLTTAAHTSNQQAQADALRQQVEALQAQLERLKRS